MQGSGMRRRAAASGALVLMLLLVAPLALVSAQWDALAGDNDRLAQMFTPPAQQAQQAPSQLEAWQAQQAGMVPPPQQQQPLAAAGQLSPNVLAELAQVLLKAAAQQQAGQPIVQQQPQQQQPFQSMFAPPQEQQPQQPSGNLYGAHAPQPQDTSFMQHEASARQATEDTILPLAPRGTSSYLFSVQPADVQEKMRRAQPVKRKMLDVFAAIPRAHRAPHRRNAVRSLESEFRSKAERSMPTPRPQRVFHLHTRHTRHALPTDPVAASPGNPFLEALTKHVSRSHSPSAPLSSSEAAQFAQSPALLAFSEAAHASPAHKQHEQRAPRMRSPAELAFQHAPVPHLADAAPEASAAPAENEQSDAAMLEMQAVEQQQQSEEQPVAADEEREFTAPVPSANFARMFKSIMRAKRARKHGALQN